MTDKLVTHEDVPTLQETRDRIAKSAIGCDWKLLRILDRLIAAAEADAPPLPEGWVIVTVAPHIQQVVWHKDGTLYRWSDCSSTVDDVEHVRDSLSPLRPTATEADVEKAAIAYMSSGEDTEWGGDESEAAKSHARFAVRTVLTAAGIEVQP